MDFKINETFDGGDIEFDGKDLVMIEGFQNMPYLGMFGGNPGNPTKLFLENEQRFDWWGNELLFTDEPNIQFNSETEYLLSQISFNSNTRLRIIDAVKKDLEFMKDFAEIVVDVSFVSVDRVEISIEITEKGNEQPKNFVYIWDRTKVELLNA